MLQNLALSFLRDVQSIIIGVEDLVILKISVINEAGLRQIHGLKNLLKGSIHHLLIEILFIIPILKKSIQ